VAGVYVRAQAFPPDFCPALMGSTIKELRIGTTKNVAAVSEDTPLISVLNVFAERRISALPVIDSEGTVLDIYVKADAIMLARDRTCVHQYPPPLHSTRFCLLLLLLLLRRVCSYRLTPRPLVVVLFFYSHSYFVCLFLDRWQVQQSRCFGVGGTQRSQDTVRRRAGDATAHPRHSLNFAAIFFSSFFVMILSVAFY
jgi:CBS domain-containing protein